MNVDPYESIIEKKSTDAVDQWVPTTSRNRPAPKDWELENSIEQGYKRHTWVYVCAKTIADCVGELPFIVVETKPNGDKERVANHNAESVIDNPNEDQDRAFQMTMRTLHLLLGGDFYDRVISVGPESNRTPAELWNLKPDAVDPVPGSSRNSKLTASRASRNSQSTSKQSSWLSHYSWKKRHGRDIELSPLEVIHGMFVDPANPFRGQSPLRAIAETVDMDKSTVTANRHLVDNALTPSGLYSSQHITNEAQAALVKKLVKDQMGGPTKSGEPMVLAHGATYQAVGLRPSDINWLSAREFSLIEVCSAFGLLAARFLSAQQSLNNMETAVKYEWISALRVAKLIGRALASRLLTKEERHGGLTIIPDPSGVEALRGDIHMSSLSWERFVKHGMPKGMAASLLHLPIGPLTDGRASYMPKNLVKVGESEE